jgi:signal transduction histidine kinase
VRNRLFLLLLALVAGALAALGVPLARSVADSRQQTVFGDRQGDTGRFAALAAQSGGNGGRAMLREELTRYDQVYGIRAAVIDRTGRTVATSRPGFHADETAVRDRVNAALGGRGTENPKLIWPWQDRQIVIASPVLSGGDVIGAAVTVSDTTRMRSAVARRWLLLGIGELVALLVGGFAAVRLTRWVLRPVHDLDTVTHEIATGQLSARVRAQVGPPELRRLATSFNDMAGHVEEAIEQQRAFVADASHQLRNPLSALLLRIETIGMGLPPDWSDELEHTREEGRRLAQVLDELLALARAESAPAHTETVDLAALAAERLTAWQVVATTRDMVIRLSGDRTAYARADPVALGSALDAVLDNALKFGPHGSAIDLVVDAGPGGDQDQAHREAEGEGRSRTVAVHVTDCGPGVEPEELAWLGRRFWRSPRHSGVDGSGLGLSIATALLEASGGRLEAARGEESGMVMSLRLPRAEDPDRSPADVAGGQPTTTDARSAAQAGAEATAEAGAAEAEATAEATASAGPPPHTLVSR